MWQLRQLRHGVHLRPRGALTPTTTIHSGWEIPAASVAAVVPAALAVADTTIPATSRSAWQLRRTGM